MGFRATYDNTTDAPARMALFFGALRADWRGLFAELRETRPVLDLPVMTVVTRWTDVVDLLSRNETFRVTYAPHMDPSVGPYMLARDGAVQNWRDKSAMRTLLRWDDLPTIRATAGEVAAAALQTVTHGARRRRTCSTTSRTARPCCRRMSGPGKRCRPGWQA